MHQNIIEKSVTNAIQREELETKVNGGVFTVQKINKSTRKFEFKLLKDVNYDEKITLKDKIDLLKNENENLKTKITKLEHEINQTKESIILLADLIDKSKFL